MILPGVMLLVMSYLNYKFTKDTPAGNFEDIPRDVKKSTKTDWSILSDWRVWTLALAYSMCFGMEITFDGVAALHFHDTFKLSQSSAGFWAGSFGFMNLFARAMGGIAADRVGRKWGMKGKGILLAALLLLEGCGIILFALAGSLEMAIISMVTFALFLKMANGTTYAITPFVNEKNVGMVSGIVGAGGNVGGMAFGFLFKSSTITYVEAFRYIGYAVIAVSLAVLITKFVVAEKTTEEIADEKTLAKSKLQVG